MTGARAGASRVTAAVATAWTSPEACRGLDEPVLRDVPDPAAWVAGMGVQELLDLDGRVLTQALAGEPAVVLEVRGEWARVALPEQPSPRDARGYPGWVRRAHLGPAVGLPEGREPAAAQRVDASGEAVLAAASAFVGTPYVWGGLSSAGIDCSGLVHLAHRRVGRRVPRDAADQAAHFRAAPERVVDRGRLLFFARPGRPVHHVGIGVRPGVMLHAPQSGGRVVVEELDDDRWATLVSTSSLGAV